MPRISSQYVLLSAARFRSKSRESQVGICTPLYPSDAAHAEISFKLLKGDASPANCARKIAGPLIVFTGLRFPVDYTCGLLERVHGFLRHPAACSWTLFQQLIAAALSIITV